jgi:putative hydrolase of the HAD superfamily
MPIRLLALDVMDTVVRDPIFHAVPRRLGCTVAELFELLDGQPWVEFETGAIDEAAYLRRMFRTEPPAGVSSHDLRDTILGGYRFVDGMEGLLCELQGHDLRIWGLSNYSPWMEQLRDRLQLDRFIEGYVLSYETGYRKPDPRAYEPLLQRAAIQAAECLFVDDRQPNVEAARKLGINAVRFESADRLRRELVGYRVL